MDQQNASPTCPRALELNGIVPQTSLKKYDYNDFFGSVKEFLICSSEKTDFLRG